MNAAINTIVASFKTGCATVKGNVVCIRRPSGYDFCRFEIKANGTVSVSIPDLSEDGDGEKCLGSRFTVEQAVAAAKATVVR